MTSRRIQGSIPLPMTIIAILAGAALISLLFFSFWQKLNHKVEGILEEQFNQQQLMLARKIADNIESYFDFLENSLQSYAGLFLTTPLEDRQVIDASLAEKFARHQRFGLLQVTLYNSKGFGVQVFSTSPDQVKADSLVLPAIFQKWSLNPEHQGRLFLSQTFVYPQAPWKGRRVMRFITALYGGAQPTFIGTLEFIIDPFFICQKATADVRSGQTGYAWIIDQDEIFLAHYEKSFVGHNAIQIRLARNPKMVFRGLRELDAALLAGKEGLTEYDSGWHRQKLGQIPKLAAYTPINFSKGLITGVTELENPAHNRWGVCVVAPVAEVSGQVREVLHQELFLAGLFFGMVILASVGLIGIALSFNKALSRQVELKTKELLESQERLIHSERFAAVGEAAAYVSHEIKNPLMVIGGLAGQVERHLEQNPAAQEKLRIIQAEIRRLESFLGDLRDFLRPAPPCKQEVNLNEVILEVKALMGEAAKEKGIAVEDRLESQLPRIAVDLNQFKQVLVNLFKNAVEATEPGGRITLSTSSQDEQVCFAIRDTGKGMPPEVRDKVFHPFFTTKEKGTGLGLAVIHKIITDHRGIIEVETTPGEGTTFTIRLPLRPDAS
jgi:two-component system sensor histidine kinase HydH